MEELQRAMEIAMIVTSENKYVSFATLLMKICTELNKRDLGEYFEIIGKFMSETRNHLRCSKDL